MKILSLMAVMSMLFGCSSHQFKNKHNQTEKQFLMDRVQCQSVASGQASSSDSSRLVTYEECMRNLGYRSK